LEHILIEKSVLVSCLDPGEEAVGKLQKKYDLGESAQVGFSQDIPFPSGEFDVVVMSEVLEHLNDEILKLTLGEVRRVLKPGAGRFIGTVPADENLLEGRVICPHCNDAFHRWGHVQSFNMANLDALLATHFTDIKISRHFFGEFAALNWKGRMSWIAKKALLKFGVKGNSENYFFLAKNH
jgi:ubiquinone/menaquinone biosynthesis C-methylase UbiE